ncbi:trypsin-like serine protease [uncultured Thiodictyon sp.]|jgi:hypothetical protein|uniref:trypsin-like serine protease n=1 Tax=uncultured Thiodictyon sp. TaxID=1846217 RepID=UPI00345A3058
MANRSRGGGDGGGCARLLLALLLCTLAGSLQALIGGQPDSVERYGFVVSLKSAPGQRCTATKIGPRIFLTAAHCVVDIPAGTLGRPWQPGGKILVSNRAEPSGDSDYQTLNVTGTRLLESFASALSRLHAYQNARIAEYRGRYSGEDLARRIRRLYMESHITARFPDLAIVLVDDETPSIPVACVDLRRLVREADVILVGYGCERVAEARRESAPVRRTWGRSRVIRVDAVNFYTFAGDLRPGSPAICPGDSGGPVLRDGKVVGVHGTVYGLGARDSARSNMSVNLHPLAGWDAWPQAAATGGKSAQP